ncbi:nitrate- and nitrite sensing domain-containing protein [Kitasatospora atroaurantiaca]|uniref:histidine kinase n=1 Tax=Kitasatospora atroaurantiaca TaxID=285545 RepID=A0A561EYE8_9ACTN|nr:nitrate- and nitrite sensing domain-containing protein [Kitasatospora atroaurantiaca]TWE20636.1 signal transduction histidine kinase [Kitasatospora atroaurantiaca]
MRLRSSSIRAKIIALLMVPIVALTSLWVYATLVTTGDVWDQLDVSAGYRAFGSPTDQYAQDVQAERRAAVLRLADSDSKAAKEAYQQAQTVTDRDLQLLRYKADGSDAGKLDADQRVKFQDVLTSADQLAAIRGQVNREANSWAYVLDQYSDLVQPVFAFRSAFVSKQSGQLPRQGTILIELARAREYLSQEDAAMEGLRLTPKPDSAMLQAALDGLHNQRALFNVYVSELGPQDQTDYRNLRTGNNWMALVSAEAFFEDSPDRVQAVKNISENTWRDAADRALNDLADLNTRLAETIGARAKSYAVNQLVRGGIAGLIGLVAVVLSIVISYRIGRGLARELIGLRNAALELSGTRLPSMMLRLRRGELVDIAAEAPALDFGPAEIGQVGRAFNEVQRVAVEAAVEQAELRRGVSAVFVNLARRSQVLLHRQLTLLDTMERRTEDPAELEDLFKLDHLTTRMRRHAEGLIILSGGSPGRAWRKPVRMVDVVRAAVGEVEDYARVIVRPFPGTGLLGSAVADVTHLIAELVENAAVYSPPQTQVTVQGEVVAHGFCLEIDDRGLGLSEQALAEINQRLAVEQEFDLADTDRLGLFVVSRLARRHGIRVHLRPSPYGGTAAVVLIPRELLAEAPDQAGEPAPPVAAPPATPPAGRRGQRELVAVPALAEDGGHRRSEGAPVAGDEPVRSVPRPTGGPRPSAAEPARTPGGLPRRRAATGGPALVPADAAGTGRHRRADSPAEEAAAAPAPTPPPAHVAPAPAGGLLPRRVRQASLAPQLKAAAAAEAAPDAAADAARERSPEEARSTFASFQRGYKRGRGDRLQPASLTVVPDPPAPPAPASPAPVVLRPRAALPSVPVPPALPAAPVRPAPGGPGRPGGPATPAPQAQPAPAEGTES